MPPAKKKEAVAGLVLSIDVSGLAHSCGDVLVVARGACKSLLRAPEPSPIERGTAELLLYNYVCTSTAAGERGRVVGW